MQNSQENTYAKISLLKSCRRQDCNFIKKEHLAQVFCCEFCEMFKNIFFTEHLRTTASVEWKQQIIGRDKLSTAVKFTISYLFLAVSTMYVILRKIKAKATFLNFTKKIMEIRNTFLKFLYFSCCPQLFSFRTFYKEALSFIIFILSLWLCSNTLFLESIFHYICQKLNKKNSYFKISSRDEVFTRFFFILG